MFNITLYVYKDKPNRVHKEGYLTAWKTIQTDAVDNNNDVLSPTIVYQSDDGSSPDFNYCKIAEYSRYYFVTGVSWLGNNLYRVDLKVDPLMTYASTIDTARGTILRTADPDLYSRILKDDMALLNPGYYVKAERLSSTSIFTLSNLYNCVVTTAADVWND